MYFAYPARIRHVTLSVAGARVLVQFFKHITLSFKTLLQ